MKINSFVAGALGGLIATAPMTAAMEAMFRVLPGHQRYSLPPRQITERLTGAIGVRHRIDEEQHTALTLINHFGYGAAAGAIYGPLAKRVPLPPVLRGILFGLLVWATSYLGLLPALGVLQPATRHPTERNLLMIAAHVIWGATLGGLTDLLQRRR